MYKVQKYFLLVIALIASFSGVTMRASAEEIVISDNGSGSDNQVNVTQSQDVNITQDNSADVNNNIEVTADTGNNSASDNTGGDTEVKTGDVSIQTHVDTAVNNSVASVGCCPGNGGGGASISGNGSHSDNTINHSFSNNVNVNVNQNANINNFINGYANTGGNTADDNTNGDVTIRTGNINVQEKIHNRANRAFVSLGLPFGSDYWLNISGNGSHSDNTIDHDEDNDIVVAVNNNADVFNQSFWELVTGNNSASDNTDGDVTIKTGDIKFESEIVNDVNESVVVVTCCEKEKEKPQPVTPAEKPVTTNGGGGGGGGDSKGKDEVQGAMEEVLPITGNLWFFLALMANILVLILGTYMRLRSGRSPAVVAA